LKVTIAVAVCVVIDDDGDETQQAVPCRKPLDDLLQRMRREMQHGRDSVNWRAFDGAEVAR